jgi:CHAD domain-containing protein
MSKALLGDAATAALADGVARLLRNDTALCESRGDAVKAVHQMRVATRRLRSDLRTFRSALDPLQAKELTRELDWLGRVLGAARDADVLLERLTESSRELPATSAGGFQRVRSTLAERRADAYAALRAATREERYSTLIERLTEAVRAPPLAGDAHRPACATLPPIVHEAWGALDRRVGSLEERPSNAALHVVRIRAKRCRYAAEACAPELGKPVRRLARAAEGLQEVLGELGDAVAAERWLREWGTHTRSPAAAFAAGELAALERAAAAHARSRWPAAYRRVVAVAPREVGSS